MDTQVKRPLYLDDIATDRPGTTERRHHEDKPLDCFGWRLKKLLLSRRLISQPGSPAFTMAVIVRVPAPM